MPARKPATPRRTAAKAARAGTAPAAKAGKGAAAATNSKFFTNQGGNTLFNKFEGVFTSNKNLREFDALIGYFRASGYFKIRPLLDNINPIRILVGIDIDTISLDMAKMGTLFHSASKEQAQEEWEKQFKEDVKQAQYAQDIENGILQFVKDVVDGKVVIKAHPSKNIHAKIYIMRPEGFSEHNSGHVITGSSNLTDAGLGTAAHPNYEFNVLLNDYNDVKFATDEFEALWEEGVEISEDFVRAAQQKTYLQDVTPYELYLKTLIEYFGDEIEFDPNSIADLPPTFKRLNYQMDAVYQTYQTMQRHNGCFLSDVVGLGKTVVATLVARLFYYKNGYPDYRSRILLVIPPALRNNWETTLRDFQFEDAVTIVTNGSIHKVENPERFDMVIIDEAHKFRNNSSFAYQYMQQITKTPTRRNTAKKLLLLSATPLNNRAQDIQNQVQLFQDGNRSTLGFSLASFFSEIDREQRAIRSEKNSDKARKMTRAIYEEIREHIFEPLMVRRTRADLLGIKRYKDDLDKQGIIFPKINTPQPLYYQLPKQQEALFDSTLKIIDNKELKPTGLCYTRYRALQFLVSDKKNLFEHRDLISNQLVSIMKTLLLKRMDSSFVAFHSTLENFLNSSRAMVNMIDNDEIYIAPGIDVQSYVLDNDEEQLKALDELSKTDPSVVKCTCEDFDPAFIKGVKRDHEILMGLVAKWTDAIKKEDPKVAKFNAELRKLLNKKQNPEQKLIIFTESKVTMRHLSEKIKADGILAVDSTSIRGHRAAIRENFDANIAEEERKSDFNLLITTDVLAEGVNLHRANTIINYDTPWNATRLMQRIGRINRIGAQADNIHIYNFYPTAQVDSEIELKRRADLKLQAFHSALGEDSQIYSDDEVVESHSIFDANIQEERNESLPYLEEIRKYREDDPEGYKRLKNMPTKVRNAVASKEQKGRTLTFMRTGDKHTVTFSLVGGKAEVETHPFTKAMKLLKPLPDAKSKPLPNNHHEQVTVALGHFTHSLKTEIVEQHANPQLAPRDAKAIRFISAIRDHSPEISEKNKDILNKAIDALRRKTYGKLAPDLVKLEKASEKLVVSVKLKKILEMLDKSGYNLGAPAPAGNAIEEESIMPSIIISQSYV